MAISVSRPEITERGGLLELSARVESPALPDGVPERVVYQVAKDPGIAFSGLGDTFLVGMLPVAMKLREPLEIAGEVSLRLAHGAGIYQDILAAWFPDSYQPVEVSVEHLAERGSAPRPDGVGCCFSGGIDSFNAVMELRPPLNRFPPFGITHALMINGFDQVADFERSGVARRLHEIYSEALDQWQVRLLMIHANLKLFRDAVLHKGEQTRSFGSPLTACAHALAPVFGRFNLSGHATYRYEDLKPMGSHPALDHHLSTDQLQVIHLGARRSRSEKLELMAGEPVVRQTLRVCFDDPEFDTDTGGVSNCGVCEKCVRTKVMLDILGQLQFFPTFTKGPPIDAYRDPRILSHVPPMFLQDLVRLARRRRHQGWYRLLRQATDEQDTDPS